MGVQIIRQRPEPERRNRKMVSFSDLLLPLSEAFVGDNTSCPGDLEIAQAVYTLRNVERFRGNIARGNMSPHSRRTGARIRWKPMVAGLERHTWD